MTYSAPAVRRGDLRQQGHRRDQGAGGLHGGLPHDDRPGHLHHQRHRAGRRLPAGALARASTSARSSTRPPTRTSSSRRSSRRRGAWLEFDVDKKDTVGVRIDRKRRQNVTVLLKALGWTADEILEAVRRRAVHPAHAGEGPRRDPGGGPRGHLPQAAAGRAAHGRVAPRRCSRTCSSTPSATTWPGSAGTRSTRSSAPPRRCSLTQLKAPSQGARRARQPRQEGLGAGPVPRLRRDAEGRGRRTGRAQVQGHPHLRGHPQDRPLPREAARRRGGLRPRRHRPLRQPPPPRRWAS